MRFQTASVRHHASRSARTAATAAAFAAAVALLALLPVFGQSTFDHTDGEIRSGSLSVGVFADIADAKLAKNVMTVFRDGTVVYVPQASPTPIESSNTLSADQTAYLADGRVSPQDTFFGDSLFVSNDPEAYNTLLIMAEQSAVQENTDGCVEATVRNGRSGAAITVQMAVTAATGGTVYYQGFVRVLDSRAEDEAGAPLYASSNGPSCVEPADPADTTPDYTDGVGQNDTASVLARHDDIVTLSVRGAGIVSVRVDGEGPELIDVTPEDLGYYRSRDLEYAFTVRDGDAGLRHDGELVITGDGDYTQVNADGDHATSGEPLTTASGGQVSVNGNAADIDVLVWARDAHVDTARDITHTGNWMLVGSRPGVEYAFAADGSGTDEGIRYMEITAHDRAGNRTVSDALDDDDGQPHLFTVDDTEPQPNQAWTGISYDPEFMQSGRETANRSWIMVGFGEALGGDIKPELIRVSDHEVVGVLHPAWGPPPDRTVLGRAGGSAPAEGERPIDIFGDLIPDARSRIYVKLARQLGPGNWACPGWLPGNMPWRRAPPPSHSAPRNGPRLRPWPKSRWPQTNLVTYSLFKKGDGIAGQQQIDRRAAWWKPSAAREEVFMVERRLFRASAVVLVMVAAMLLVAHGPGVYAGGEEDKTRNQGQDEVVVPSEDQVPAIPDKRGLKFPNLGSHLDRLVVQPDAGQASIQDAAGGAAVSPEESVAVTIHLSGSVPEVVAFLEDNGAEPRNVGEDYIEAYVPVTLLGPVSELPGVLRMREIVPPRPTQLSQRVIGNGPAVHGPEPWNDAGYTGQGIKVGVIDVGFKGISSLLGTEIPSNVLARCYTDVGVFTSNLADCEAVDDVSTYWPDWPECIGEVQRREDSGAAHGTIVAESMLDIAPGATLYVAYPRSQGDMQTAVDWMVSEGVQVINHSVSWTYDGPGDGTSPLSISPLNTVDHAVSNDILWVNSAGNHAAHTWFGSYSDPDSDGAISFGGVVNDEVNNLPLRACRSYRVQLRWEDGWQGAKTDLDLYLYNTTTRELHPALFSADLQSGEDDHEPFETLGFFWRTDSDEWGIAVDHVSGPAPAWVQVVAWSVDPLEVHTRAGSIGNPSESANPGMLAVGAAHWNDVRAIEPYSSRGPTPDGRIKPDVVGADCGATALAPLDEYNQGFCGTSQAAPHVAGMAALVRQRFPDYSLEQVASYLKDNAEQRQLPDPNNTWGHGFARLPPPDGPALRAPVPSKAFTRNPAADFDTLSGALNRAPRGIWSDGTTMWVADSLDDKIYAYDMATRARVPGRDFDTLSAAGNVSPRGIWSDGTTMWVADSLDDKIYAYDVATKARKQAADFDTLKAAGNTWPRGIWSDGETMWVADWVDEKIYAYDVATKARVPGRDFDTLRAARNTLPRGIWSDGTTLWVADWFREKVYAYDVATRERVSGKEFNTLEAAGNWGPQGIWSDGTTMWVADWLDGKVYAYSMPKESAADKEALIAFYNATGGITWTNNSNWLTSSPIGQWHGVTTDDDGRVTHLDLSDNQLSGEIPSELGNLANLRELVLSVNQLTGPVPPWLGSLANLEVLRLGGNELSGEIPSELRNLAGLRELVLSENQLTGPVPPWLGGLANLEVLHLLAIELSGEIPSELGNLANLRELELGVNQLTGPVPPWLGSLANLEELGLWGNELSGEIPEQLGNLANLKELGLGGNELSGEIPSELGNLANLQVLRLNGNRLSGEIPSALGNLANLESLDLSGNQLTGPVPPWLGNLANLKELDLGGNELSGEIPSELRNLANLEVLRLGGNELSGEIPSELGNLANLEWLALGENQLTGPVPPWLGSLTNLQWLHLGGNELSGEIPSELRNLANLQVLWLGGNELSGEIPSELDNLANLEWLVLGENKLTGPVPPWLGSLTNLKLLRLGSNELSGEMPSELRNLAGLEWLELSENQLTGTVPSWLGSLANLEWLHLGGNQLSGEIPSELGNLANLRELGLSENQLNGPVPPWLGSLANLQVLRLGGNELSGEIPSELGNLAGLRELGLSENQLTGTVPSWLGSLANLEWLHLGGNRLSGEVPEQLGSLAVLKVLRLWDNELTGALPQALTGLTVLDELSFYLNPGLCAPVGDPFQTWLGGIAAVHGSSCAPADSQEDRAVLVELYNDTDGGNWADRTNWLSERPIREWYGVTSDAGGRVTGLYLWRNQLQGEMPASLGSLANLERLWLDGNSLSGELPVELGSLANLEELRLSGNRLTGCVHAGLREVLDDDFDELGLPLCGPSVTLSAASSAVRLGAP
ncbi:MAG: leucine-rich repeat domain-containing protein, partial [Chloroflexi bacterium]|nr:leucine-rich repeat domain-containing protein [Chloroflexota bacterium]